MRRLSKARFQLAPPQRKTIYDTAASLPPNRRHDFLLAVSKTLQLNAPGFPTNLQVEHAIASALAEVQA